VARRAGRDGSDRWHTTTVEASVVDICAGCIAVDEGRSSEVVAPIGARPPPGLDDRVRVTSTAKLHHAQTITAGGAA
jgi:hypothetical protein